MLQLINPPCRHPQSPPAPAPRCHHRAAPQPLPGDLQLVTEVHSSHNHIRFADISPRASGHPLADTCLLLDAPARSTPSPSPTARHSPLTSTYFDVFATLPPLLLRPSLAVLSFGARSTPRTLLHFFSDISVHGWEIDPAITTASRDFFGLAELEEDHASCLFIHVGSVLKAEAMPNSFGGALVDLFANGSVLPELQEAATWRTRGRSGKVGGGASRRAEEEEGEERRRRRKRRGQAGERSGSWRS